MLKNRNTLIVRVPSSNLSLTQRRLWTLDFNILSIKQCVLPGIWGRLFNPKSKEKESSQSHFFFSLSARLWNPWIKWELAPATISLFSQNMQGEELYLSVAVHISHLAIHSEEPFICDEKLSAKVTISPPGQIVTTCPPELPWGNMRGRVHSYISLRNWTSLVTLLARVNTFLQIQL